MKSSKLLGAYSLSSTPDQSKMDITLSSIESVKNKIINYEHVLIDEYDQQNNKIEKI